MLKIAVTSIGNEFNSSVMLHIDGWNNYIFFHAGNGFKIEKMTYNLNCLPYIINPFLFKTNQIGFGIFPSDYLSDLGGAEIRYCKNTKRLFSKIGLKLPAQSVYGAAELKAWINEPVKQLDTDLDEMIFNFWLNKDV